MEGLQGLLELAESLESLDRAERIETLTDYARRYQPVPEWVAGKPYPERNKVPGCESEVYAFMVPDSGVRFAVENRQGVSAMALAAILQEFFGGAWANEIEQVPDEIVYRLFGRELSMGKSMGLINMVATAKALAGAAK